MSEGWVILLIASAYLGGLFAIAYVGDRRADQGRSVINNPYIYTLSIAVYCTAWTYYGSVGRAAVDGLGFLPIYLGPTLMACLWWFVLRKMLRITKAYGITSIADFVASRYGKNALLGGLVTIVAVFGVMPYISLQLKAVSTSVAVILDYPAEAPFWRDLALFVALLLAAFSILFGTRHIDATEHHEGMVAAIAFESIVKLVAFVTIGLYVTFGLYDGFGDIFTQARAAGFGALLTFRGAGLSFADWFALTCLAGMAVLFLPRQFQVAVIENINEDHLNKAIWLFPLYLLVINLFVLPIALAGRLRFPGGEVDADFMILLLPMVGHQHLLTLFTFLGGLSAATAMVIVATVALSTMLCNDLIMPVLLRLRFLRLNEQPDLSGLLLTIRRGSILAMLLLGYAYFRMVGESYALVTMGLVSFCAAAQFAPPILFGIYWKAATLRGALTGLLAGFLIWLYTLLLPALARSDWIDPSFLDGPFGLEILKPYALFGVSGLDPVSHSLLWSLLANVAGLVGWSLLGRQGSFERIQASLFVEVDRLGGGPHLWRGSAAVADLRALLARYVGAERAEQALARHARARGLALAAGAQADADLVNFAERLLAGAIGAASARVMISTVVKSADFSPDEVMAILDEASQVIEYSRELEREVAGARDHQRGTAPGQPAPDRARPPEGRVHLDGQPRAAHALDLDPLVLRDPARQPRARGRPAQPVPRHRGQGIRAPDPADQRHPGHVADRVRQDGMASLELRPEGGDRRRAGRHQRPVPGQADHGRAGARDRGAGGHGRPRPADAGGDQPALERGQVRPGGRWPGPGPPRDLRAGAHGQRRGQRSRDPARAMPDGVRALPSAGRRRDDRQARGLGARPDDLPADRRALRRPHLGRAGGAAGRGVPLHPAGRPPAAAPAPAGED